ncbi:MAG: HAD family hydrolase [Acidimicrobiia bacterium]
MSRLPNTDLREDGGRAGELSARPDALMFDLDGVLADVSGSYRRTILEVCRQYGVEIHPSQVSSAKAAGGANDDWELTRRLLSDQGVEAELDDVRRRFNSLYWGTTAHPGLRSSERLLADRSLLEGLAAALRLAVVTGRPRREAETFLESVGVAHLFAVLVAREDAPPKPDPAPVRLASTRLRARRAWLFGDTPDDMRAAVGAGVVPIGVVAPDDSHQLAATALRRAGAVTVLGSVNEIRGML